MRHLYFLLLISAVFFSCNSTKVPLEQISETMYMSNCPDGGTCDFEVLKGSSVKLVEDEFGHKYPHFEPSHYTNVLKVSYTREVPEGIMDAQYSEVYYMEVKKSQKKLSLKDKSLYKAKLIYGRKCRCPGQTGYEYVMDGTLDYRKKRTIVSIETKVEQTTFPVIMNKFALYVDVFQEF